ncbi:MAG: putative dipeptide transporter [Chloroflexi bacterium]|nr:putative dipeptide transporter [Chloroflexota bacterium]
MAVPSRNAPWLRATGSVLVAGVVIASTMALQPARPARADTSTLLVASDITDAKTMDPGHFYEFTSNDMATNAYDELIHFVGTDTAHPKPWLATDWKVSGGGKVYTFNLRHGVKFASGNPLTAADVVFSYRRLLYLGDNPSFLISGATDISAVSPYTVKITLSSADASFLSALADNNFGVLDSKLVIAHGGDDSKDAAKKDKAQSFLDSQSAGTGAFQLTNWTRNSQLVLQRNTNYWGPRPSLAKIIFQNTKGAATQRLLVQRGAVDVAINVNIDQQAALAHDTSVQVVKGNTLDLVYIGMTLSPKISKPLSNALVRQAVRYAIDYDGILKGLLKGVGTRPNGMIPVGMLGNDTATNNSLLIRQDIAKAKSLLTKAGYPNGFSATMSYDVGLTFDGVSYDPIAAKVQNDLAKVGIKLTLNPEQDSLLLPAYRAQKVQMILYEWGVDYPDPNDYAGPFSPGGGPAKRMYYTNNPALASLVAAADTTTDTAKRIADYRKVQQTWLQESPFIGLVQPQNIIVLGSNIKGYVYSPVQSHNVRTIIK